MHSSAVHEAATGKNGSVVVPIRWRGRGVTVAVDSMLLPVQTRANPDEPPSLSLLKIHV